MLFRKITIVGAGMLGGTIGRLAREKRLAERVVAVGHRKASVAKAVELGAADEGTLDAAAGVRDADLVVIGTGVDEMAAVARKFAPHLKKFAIVTDIGSAKGKVVRELEAAMPEGVRYVGSHPITGSEKRGIEAAGEADFSGATVVVTPTRSTDRAALGKVRKFWEALGSKVVEMSPEEHDKALAAVSHLPHLVASALVNFVGGDALKVAGGGFRDATRIASGDPKLWLGIIQHNRREISSLLEAFGMEMSQLARDLAGENDKSILKKLKSAKARRDRLARGR